MKLGNIKYTPESQELGGDTGLVANQEPGGEVANPDDQAINELADDSIPDEQAAALEGSDERADTFNKSLDQSNKAMNDLTNASQTLDELQSASNSMIQETGTMTPVAAEIVSTTLESIYRNLDVDRPALPSMEAFAGRWTKRDASRLTMEAMEKANTGILSKIVSGIKTLLNSIIGFITGIFNNRVFLKMRLEKLKKRLMALEGYNEPKSSKLTGRHVAAFQYKDKVDFNTIITVMTTATESINYYDNINTAIQNLRDSREPDSEISKVSTTIGRVTKTKVSIDGKEMELLGAYVNGKSLVYESGEDNMTRVKFVTNIPDRTERVDTMDSLNPAEIKALLNWAIDNIDSFSKAEGRFKTITASVMGIVRRIENEYNRFRSSMGSEEHTALAKVRARSRALTSYLSELVGRLPSQIFSASSHAAGLAEKAISNLHNPREKDR